MKYLCEPDRKLRYDPTESSFPNHIEFRELEADLARKEEVLRDLPTGETLKQAMLDFVFQHREVPDVLMRQLAKREYHLLLSRYSQLGGLFREFTPGQLQLLDDTGGSLVRQYLYAWGAFDVLTNRPHVYLLLFEQDARVPSLERDDAAREAFFVAVKKHTVNTAPLRIIAQDLDEALQYLRPKVLKRMDIGPLYGRYAKDDSLYTRFLNAHFGPADLAMKYTTEIVFSIGEEKKKKGFLNSGRLRQVFFVDKSNPETLERNVSRVDAYLLATHGVVQYLHDHHKNELDKLAHPPFTFVPAKASAGIDSGHGT